MNRFLVIAVLASTLAPGVLIAQQTATYAPASASVVAPATAREASSAVATPSTGPRAVPVGIRPLADRQDAGLTVNSAAASRPHAGSSIALMVVGAAGIGAGILIGGGGGAAVSVGSAAVGLYGLYQFLK